METPRDPCLPSVIERRWGRCGKLQAIVSTDRWTRNGSGRSGTDDLWCSMVVKTAVVPPETPEVLLQIGDDNALRIAFFSYTTGSIKHFIRVNGGTRTCWSAEERQAFHEWVNNIIPYGIDPVEHAYFNELCRSTVRDWLTELVRQLKLKPHSKLNLMNWRHCSRRWGPKQQKRYVLLSILMLPHLSQRQQSQHGQQAQQDHL